MKLPRDMNLTLWISTLGITWEQYHTHTHTHTNTHTHIRSTTLEVSRDRYVTYSKFDTAIFGIPDTPHARHKEFASLASHIPGTHLWDQWETDIWHDNRQWYYPEICVYHTHSIFYFQRDVRMAAVILDVPRFPNSHIADFEVFCLTFRPLPLLWGTFGQTDCEK